MVSAAIVSSARICSRIAQPTIFRVNRSRITARYSQPSPVGISVISASQTWSGFLGREIAIQQIGGNRQGMLAVGGTHAIAARHVSPDAMPAHDPLDPLAADALALGTQLGMNTWRPISAPMVVPRAPHLLV